MNRKLKCFVLTAAAAVLTSCGRPAEEPLPDKINTDSVTTTTSSSEKHHEIKTTTSAGGRDTAPAPVTEKDIRTEHKVKITGSDTGISQPVANPAGTKNKMSSGIGGASVSLVQNASSGRQYSVITDTPPDEPEKKEYTDIGNIADNWIYQQLDTEGIRYTNSGSLEIRKNGSFEYRSYDGGDVKKGDIRLSFDEIVRDRISYFALYEDNGEMWIGCNCIQFDPDIYYIGNGNSERIIRESVIDKNADLSDISDEWEYQEIDRLTGEYVTAGNIEVMPNGDFTYLAADGEERADGVVTKKYELLPDGTQKPYFAFYLLGGELWKACYCDQIDYNVFYAGNGGTCRFVRIIQYEEIDAFRDIADEWEYQEKDASTGKYTACGYISIDQDGYYTYVPVSGDEKSGRIREEYRHTDDDFTDPYFVFYDYGQHKWLTFSMYQTDISVFEAENVRLVRYNEEPVTADDFIGEWNCYRLSLSIYKEDDHYIAWVNGADSASEYFSWKYRCVYDAEKHELVCDDNGIYTVISYPVDEDGNVGEPVETEVSGDASASFSINGKALTWNEKEYGTGGGVLFLRAE